MIRPERYDVLFEPVRIGPVTTKNRFYQVPSLQRHGPRLSERHGGDARGARRKAAGASSARSSATSTTPATICARSGCGTSRTSRPWLPRPRRSIGTAVLRRHRARAQRLPRGQAESRSIPNGAEPRGDARRSSRSPARAMDKGGHPRAAPMAPGGGAQRKARRLRHRLRLRRPRHDPAGAFPCRGATTTAWTSTEGSLENRGAAPPARGSSRTR